MLSSSCDGVERACVFRQGVEGSRVNRHDVAGVCAVQVINGYTPLIDGHDVVLHPCCAIRVLGEPAPDHPATAGGRAGISRLPKMQDEWREVGGKQVGDELPRWSAGTSIPFGGLPRRGGKRERANIGNGWLPPTPSGTIDCDRHALHACIRNRLSSPLCRGIPDAR